MKTVIDEVIESGDGFYQIIMKYEIPDDLKLLPPKYLDMFNNYGYGNGYIVIPQDKVKYVDIDKIGVHGGITYQATLKEFGLELGTSGDDLVIGFDTAHFNDSDSNRNFVVNETMRMLLQVQEQIKNKVESKRKPAI